MQCVNSMRFPIIALYFVHSNFELGCCHYSKKVHGLNYHYPSWYVPQFLFYVSIDILCNLLNVSSSLSY